MASSALSIILLSSKLISFCLFLTVRNAVIKLENHWIKKPAITPMIPLSPEMSISVFMSGVDAIAFKALSIGARNV